MTRKHRGLRAAIAVVGAGALLALSACTSATGTQSTASGTPAKLSGTLNVWVRGAGDSQTAYQMIFDQFTKKTGVKINVFATLTDFETKLSAAAAAHKLPDVVIDDASQLGNFEQQGIITPVDRKNITDASDLTARAWDSAKAADGQYLAVPFSAQANLLLIRSDWLTKLGLKAPTTWDQLVDVAKAFTDDDPDGDGKADTYGIAIPGSTTRGYISWNWSTYLWQNGGNYVTTKNGKVTPTINSANAVDAAKWFQGLFCTDKVVQPGALNDDTTATNQAWQTGVVGMYLTGPYAFATSDASAVKGKYEVVAPPKGPDGAATLAEGTNIYLMAGSRQTAAADALASYMVTPKAQTTGMVGVPTASIVRLPVKSKVNASAVHGYDPRWELAQKVYQDEGVYEPVALESWQEMRQDASNTLNSVISTCGDTKAALDSLQQQYKALLGR